MGVSKRFIGLLSLGVLVLIPGIILNFSLSFFISYNLLCFALLIIDYYITIDSAYINIESPLDTKLIIYEPESLVFIVHNTSNCPLYIELLDDLPDYHFEAINSLMKGFILPNEKKAFEYSVIPSKRGAFTFKTLNARYLGRLQMCTKSFQIKLEREYKVYPNLNALRKYRLNICNNRRLKQGQRQLRAIGIGTSFESLREYVPRDEYRRINWKATARSNKPIINQYEPEKNQHVHIFIDTGRAMGYEVRGYSKLDMAIDTALVLSDVINQNGDKSALLIFNIAVDSMILPGAGVAHRNKILNTLYHINTTNLTSNYNDAFYYYKRKEHHRSIIFLFTDFETIDEADNMVKALPIVSKNNLVVIIFIKNESLETLVSNSISTKNELFNKGVALELMEERHKIIRMLNTKGMMCVECAVENLEYTVINKYIQAKNRNYF